MEGFSCPIKAFPCNYLGLPLHFRSLHIVEVQLIIDKLANIVATWKRKFLNKACRLKLLNTVMSSIPTYFLSVFHMKKWAIKWIDKIMRGFLWKRAKEAKGSLSCEMGQCSEVKAAWGPWSTGSGALWQGLAATMAVVPMDRA